MNLRRGCGILLAVIGIAGVFLLGSCGGGGGGSEPGPEPTGEVIGSRFSEVVASKLAATLGLDGGGQASSSLWEAEDTSAWKDAELFANRILGEVEVPALEEMQISLLTDKMVGDERTVVVRVQVADIAADYRVSMRKVSDRWRVTGYEVTERSEEHTSELQSHSFISYAVFCLKKKTHLM